MTLKLCILSIEGFTTFLGVGIYRSYAHTNLVVLIQISRPEPPGSSSLRFGAADVVGWMAGLLFILSSFGLLLDEFIHEAAKLGTRWPCVLTLLRFGAARLDDCRRCSTSVARCLSCGGSRCCRRPAASGGDCVGSLELGAVTKGSVSRQRRRATNVPPESIVYRPTTGQILSTKRTWRS